MVVRMPQPPAPPSFHVGMTVRLCNGEVGRVRASYVFESVLAPHEGHRRALVDIPGGTTRDVREDEIAERVADRPRLRVVVGGRNSDPLGLEQPEPSR